VVRSECFFFLGAGHMYVTTGRRADSRRLTLREIGGAKTKVAANITSYVLGCYLG